MRLTPQQLPMPLARGAAGVDAGSGDEPLSEAVRVRLHCG